MMKYLSTFIVVFLSFPVFLSAQVTIQMEEDAGVYKVPCKVNGMKLKFIFDTGASTVSISSTLADLMLENDYLSLNDFQGSGQSQIADGKIVDHTKIILEEIEIGGMTIKNVEAVVIHQQSAPLLLGQSAIQKLGKVSFSGDKLTINSYQSTNPYIKTNKKYTDDELSTMCREATQLYLDNQSVLAIEKYDILFSYDYLFGNDLYYYGCCLSNVKRNREAMDVFMSIEEWTKANDRENLISLYSNICMSAFFAGEYELSIKYGRLCQYNSEFPMNDYYYSTLWIAESYYGLGEYYSAKNILLEFLSKYLKFMEIYVTDCWDKGFKDPIIAGMFNSLALFYDTYAAGKKYILIAAAWGSKDCIEKCMEFDWSYTSKPDDYVY